MAAADFFLKRGDQLPALVVILKDATGAVVNLTGATVRFIMVNRYDGSPVIDASATVVDAAAGKVAYSWDAGETTVSGFYSAEFEVTFASGLSRTFPNDTNIQIQITDDLGGVVQPMLGPDGFHVPLGRAA